MTQYNTIEVTIDGRGVATLLLNRPEKRNALSAEMIEELTQFAQTAGKDKTVRVVVLEGRGDMFCAGGDLAWMKAQINADRATRMSEAKKLAMMLYALNTMPLPLIGKIHGGAFGGAIGMASICDVAVAADDTKFGLTETRLGLIPATIGPYVIARMGEGKARRVFMSARIFDAEEAKDLGLISRAAPLDALDELVDKEVKPYLSTAPSAVGAAKALAQRLGGAITQEMINHSIECLADTWEGPEAAEGIDAFFAKRPAQWV